VSPPANRRPPRHGRTPLGQPVQQRLTTAVGPSPGDSSWAAEVVERAIAGLGAVLLDEKETGRRAVTVLARWPRPDPGLSHSWPSCRKSAPAPRGRRAWPSGATAVISVPREVPSELRIRMASFRSWTDLDGPTLPATSQLTQRLAPESGGANRVNAWIGRGKTPVRAQG
jgi:hypothetical protein